MKKPQSQKQKQKTRRQPLRRCVGCGEMKDKSTLIRVALDKTGAINIDPTSKMPGRAAYICPSAECLEKTQKTKGLERSFKRPVPHEIYEQLIPEVAKCPKFVYTN